MNQANQVRLIVFSRRSVSKRRKCIYAPTHSGISCAMSCSYTIRILWIFCSSISLCSELDPFLQMVRVGKQKDFVFISGIVNRHILRDIPLQLHSYLQVNEVDIHSGLDNPSRSTAELDPDNSATFGGGGAICNAKHQRSRCIGKYLKYNISTLLPRNYPDT